PTTARSPGATFAAPLARARIFSMIVMPIGRLSTHNPHHSRRNHRHRQARSVHPSGVPAKAGTHFSVPESWARMGPGFRRDATFEHGMSTIAEQEARVADLRRSRGEEHPDTWAAMLVLAEVPWSGGRSGGGEAVGGQAVGAP